MGFPQASSLQDFVAQPVGRSLAGRNFLYWCETRSLVGFSLWGRPSEDDIVELGAVLRTAGGTPHSSLVDATLIEGIDPPMFAALERYTTKHTERLSHEMIKVGLVRPSGGIVGAIACGILQVIQAPYPIQAFTGLEPAIAWLGGPPDLAERVRASRDELARVTPLLSQLRSVFQQLGPQPADEVAKRLALSKRTLVRRLTELGTSFNKELSQYRIATAQKLMRETQAPLTSIAIDAGFGSVQRFCTAFRKATGQTPSGWREAGAK